MENVKMSKAMSVWAVWGQPIDDKGMSGAFRSKLFLMEMADTEPAVGAKFEERCSQDDQVKYVGCRIMEFKYVGWVWTEI